jgi:hypothetical protein
MMKLSSELRASLSQALAREIIRERELHAVDIAMGYQDAVLFARGLHSDLEAQASSDVDYKVALYLPPEKEDGLLPSISEELRGYCASFGRVVNLREEVARVEERRRQDSATKKLVLTIIFVDSRISSYGRDVVPGHSLDGILKSIVRERLEVLAPAQLELARSIGIERWCSKQSAELPNKRTTAANVTEFVLKLSSPDKSGEIGRYLYLVGLVPDGRTLDSAGSGGLDDVAIRENAQVMAKLGRNALLNLAQRFEKAGVRDDEKRVRFRVVKFLERRGGAHENLGDVATWGPELLQHGDDLLFDKWLIHSSVPLPIRALTIKSFRDSEGRVIPRCKLRQDPPNDADAALYIEVVLDSDTGEVRTRGSVNVEWDTDPRTVVGIDKWEVTIVSPEYLRDLESEANLAKRKVKGSLRKATIQLVNVDPLLHPSGTKLVVRIRALDEFGNYVEFADSNPRREVDVESNEFEVRYSHELPPAPSSSTDNAPSLAFALLDAVTTHAFDSPKAKLVGFVEDSMVHLSIENQAEPPPSGAKSRMLQARLNYHIRSSEMLALLQLRLLRDVTYTHAFSAAVTSSAQLDAGDFEAKVLVLPEEFLKARKEFFDAIVESASPITEAPPSSESAEDGDAGEAKIEVRHLVEFATWSKGGPPTRVSHALDSYLEAYLRGLREGCTDLLSIDTLEISVSGIDSVHRAAVLMPTHPLRAAWLRDYEAAMSNWQTLLAQLRSDSRPEQMDLELCKRLNPANQPFIISAFDGSDLAWAEEPIFGYGFYMSPTTVDDDGRDETTDYEGVAEAMIRALGLTRSEVTRQLRVAAVTRAFRSQVESQLADTRVSVIALNPGSGDLIAGAIKSQQVLDTEADDEMSLRRHFDVLAYSGFIPFSLPLEKVADLQKQLRSATLKDRLFLLPPLSVTQRPRYRKRGSDVEELLSLDDESAHIAIAHGLVDGVVNAVSAVPQRRDYVYGLVSPLVSTLIEDSDEEGWQIGPSQLDDAASTLRRANTEHLRALATLRKLGEGCVGIRASLGGRVKRDLGALHRRSDRVVLSDRFASLEWFRAAADDVYGEAYIIDYAPDFVEGFGDRVIVSTSHKEEFLRIFERSLEELGLERFGSRQVFVDNLLRVSGRLALQLVGNNPQAHEAAGLAIVIEALSEKREIEDWFVIPVDSHPELFGASVRPNDEPPLRCDLLLVKFDDGELKIRCVEVKARNAGNVDVALKRHIAAQLASTESVLRERFLTGDSPRVDEALQLAHFRSILHHYLERAATNGILGNVDVARWHEYIENWNPSAGATITREGFIVSIEDMSRPSEEVEGAMIRFVCAEDLSNTRLTSKTESRTRAVDKTSTGTRDTARPEGESLSGEEGPPSTRPTPTPQPPPAAPAANVTDPANSGKTSVGPSGNASMPSTSADAKQASSVAVDLGTDQSKSPVIWKIETKGSPHAFIVGSTGSGKSVTTRRIIRAFSEHAVPTMVIDYHGDMADDAPNGAQVLSVARDGLGFHPFEIGSDPTQLNAALHEISEVISFVCELGDIQQNHIYRALIKAFQDVGWTNGRVGERLPTMAEFAAAVDAIEKGAKGKNARVRITPITDFGLFRDDAKGFNPLGAGRGLVIDLRGQLEVVQLAASSFLLRKIYREMFNWPADSTIKVAAILDEAHRFARDKSLPKILKEGRKYGVSVVVASQSVDDFDKNVLVNCGTKIVFKTNFPESKMVAKLLQRPGGQDLGDEITRLPVGTAFCSTGDGTVRRVSMKM